MPNSDLRDFYKRYLAALNRRDFHVMDKFIHDEVTLNGKPSSREDIVTVQRHDAAAVPNLHWTLMHLIVEGDRLGAWLRNTGTPVGTFTGIASTGKSFEITQYAIYQVENGRFKHMATIRDAETLAVQLTS